MRWINPLIAALIVSVGYAFADEGNTHPPAGFFAGNYVVLGKLADNGEVFEGTASLVVVDEALRLHKRVNGLQTTWTGRFEVPSPPGEGTVLRFRNLNSGAVSTCLWTVDLDNYPRLSCQMSIRESGNQTTVPGLEAYYPVSSWPDTAKDEFMFPNQ